MSLTEYRRKRQFNRTREPEPGKPLTPGDRAIFVVQLHHASRRHYDFRLQVGDALKSWAVPKGPSYDPKVKRMAVEVEDHPVDYASFEGEIPKGEYGGGHVAQFDHGVWSTQYDAKAQLAKGHLRFQLFGEKLKGGWHLVRSGKAARQPQWLLFKDDDAYASDLEADDLLGDVTPAPAADVKRAGRGKTGKKGLLAPPEPRATSTRAAKKKWATAAAKLPGAKKATLDGGAFEPQLAKLGDAPPSGERWLHEVKWDGYRLVATIVAGRVRLWSRNALEWTGKVPEVAQALEQLGLRSAALDGELIAGTGTQQDFNVLQATLSGEQQGALSYVLFDLLHLDGIAIDQAPLLERKRLLEAVLADAPPSLAYSSHIPVDGAAAFALAGEQHFEGIISKRADGVYHPGRGDDWRKTKSIQSDEFAVVGTLPPKGSRKGFGALLLARPDGAGGWSYAGRVGSGFSDRQLDEISAHIGNAGSATPTVEVPASQKGPLRAATWFDPLFVAEVYLRGISGQGLLRQPSLKTIRLDKDPGDLMSSDKSAPKPSAEPIKISSPTKLIYPDARITKADVAAYYEQVMDYLLPEVINRPLSVIRCPSGTAKACFFQKHHTAGMERVDLVRLKEEAGTNANYLVVRDAAGLMELVQFNALEFHPWGSFADNPDVANRVVFDLDPGPDVPFAEVKQAARDVRKLLQQAGLVSFLRTTGGKGLHVVVPLNPGCEWELVKHFAHGFADALAESEPERFIAVSTLKLRPGKIFIDYLRNSRGATAIASYSLRAREGAPVALPLTWAQLGSLKAGNEFDLRSVPPRLRRRRKDPWEGINSVQQDLSRWSAG
ncbi:DNA ligase D [Lysobacter sp. H21R4]|uniref:DNA ligase D n=1 Tax=Lysobacter sp. H21R4 TaxID=2781021 RepID=UPI0018882730|nr:DNA ligase D [Lysobacter sp. H21R4]QOY61662.1 DNA ligase D [Lysobacter sp. H21R4]